MTSSSGRRSASSDGSKKRRSVYISGDQTRHAEALPEPKVAVSGRARSTRRSSNQPPPLERGTGKPKAGPGRSKSTAAPRQPAGRTHARAEAPPVRKAQRSEGAIRFAEAKRDEREARHASRRFRIRLVAGVVAAAIVVVVVGSALLYRSPAFSVTSVAVTGNTRVSRDRVLALAAIPPDATLLRLPASEIEARIGKDPWVSAVSVGRSFPDKVTIAITERVPVALVDLGKPRGVWVVDANGSFITSATAANRVGLPLLRDVVSNATAISMSDPPPTMLNALKVLGGLGRRDGVVHQGWRRDPLRRGHADGQEGLPGPAHPVRPEGQGRVHRRQKCGPARVERAGQVATADRKGNPCTYRYRPSRGLRAA